MGELSYSKLLNRTLELYRRGLFTEAYEYITENSASVAGNPAQIMNFRYSLACRAGLTDLAMKILNEAVVEKGYWYSYDYLMSDDDLLPLHQYDDFLKVAQLCQDRESHAKAETRPDVKVLKGSDPGAQRSLLLALHGNEENMDIAEEYWASATNNGYEVVLPQSSQIGFWGGYYWNDLGVGTKDIQEVLGGMGRPTENEGIVVAGFSAGARLALHSILTGVLKVKGFIFVAPWVPEIEEWAPLIDSLKGTDIRGCIVVGDQDLDCCDCTDELADLLEARGIPLRKYVVEGLEHDFPDDFGSGLSEMLDFVNPRK